MATNGVVLGGSMVKNYKFCIKYIRKRPEQIVPTLLPKRKPNFGAISKYAKTNNICVASLSAEEKERLVQKVEESLKRAEERAELEGWIDTDHLEKELRLDVHRTETVDSSHKEPNDKTQ